MGKKPGLPEMQTKESRAEEASVDAEAPNAAMQGTAGRRHQRVQRMEVNEYLPEEVVSSAGQGRQQGEILLAHSDVDRAYGHGRPQMLVGKWGAHSVRQC